MNAPKTADILIQGGTILCMDKELRVLENHTLAISEGRIMEIFPSASGDYTATKTIDASNCIVMPGLINAHTHLPMTYFRGLADDLPLEVWLNDYIWPLEAKLLTHEFIRDASLHGACEMIKHGITQVHEMYFDMPVIAQACSEAGLRALIGGAVLDNLQDMPGQQGTWDEQLLAMRAQFASDPLLDFDLAPHSIYVCQRSTLEKCVRVASEHGFRLHIHLSETRSEVTNCLREHGKKPVFYLEELGFLDLPAVYAHAIWVDSDEIDLLATKPASIAICTECNLKLASGILPLKAYLDKGVNACFATDGVASNNNLDLLAELDFTAKLHKAVNNDPSFLPAVKVLQMATCDAAKALGVSERRGSLEPGKDADICILDLNGLDCLPLYNPYSHVVYTLGSRHVRDVIINGHVVLEQGQLTLVDEAELSAKARSYGSLIQKELCP